MSGGGEGAIGGMGRYGLRLGGGMGLLCPSCCQAFRFHGAAPCVWVRPLDGLMWDFGDGSSTLHPMGGEGEQILQVSVSPCVQGCAGGHAGGCTPPLLMPWHLVALRARSDHSEIQYERESCDGCEHPWGCGCHAAGRDGVWDGCSIAGWVQHPPLGVYRGICAVPTASCRLLPWLQSSLR